MSKDSLKALKFGVQIRKLFLNIANSSIYIERKPNNIVRFNHSGTSM